MEPLGAIMSPAKGNNSSISWISCSTTFCGGYQFTDRQPHDQDVVAVKRRNHIVILSYCHIDHLSKRDSGTIPEIRQIKICASFHGWR